ncbi:hypothetical protein NQ315_000567 [Exocentrus adspersus]|uniref:Tyr recombinase domain-containing protein n=1 Tax=Exocentrus adspersus TaxID=1586481 RepID=A0AAV8VG69_9CUCU|nr:hypothetical protein NQ315_000567 [Exocentrus adspersus]
MVEFDNWRKKRGLGEGAITEEVLLAYFFNVEKLFAASSMWTKYSMLKSMLKVHKGIDISNDVQDKGSYLYVVIPDTKTNISRSFMVMEEAFSVNGVEMCRKYISLRPKAAGRRFFLRYVDGKCSTQHVGINTISKTFSKVASFLGLPDPESFTGHGMRRSSATLLANAGGDITTVKRHGGWKSTTVAENYIEESLSSKMAIAEKNPGAT